MIKKDSKTSNLEKKTSTSTVASKV